MNINSAMSHSNFRQNIKSYLSWLFFLVLMAWNLYQMCIHAMWRDELHSWLIASTSNSFSDLIENTRWEGHPIVWYICLWLASFASKAPVTIKILHYIIGMCSSLLIMVKAPFSAPVRLLIVAGYFFSFEYLLISRNYALGVLIIVIFISFYEACIKKPIYTAIALGLLANTSMYGAFVSLALISGVIIDLLINRDVKMNKNITAYVFPAILYAIFLFVCFITVKRSVMGLQVSNAGFANAIPDLIQQRISDIFNTTSIVIRSIIPIPEFSINFWNTSFVDTIRLNSVIYTVLFSIIILIYFILKDTIIGISVFAICFVSILLFNALFLYKVGLRHNGMLYICLISCAWLGQKAWRNPCKQNKSPSLLERPALIIVLIANVIATVIAHYYHTLYPFSNGLVIAEIMKSPPYYNSISYVGYPDTMVTTVTGYLNKPFYYPSTESHLQYFPKWGSRYKISQYEAVWFAKNISNSINNMIFFVTTQNIEDNRMSLVKKTSNAIVKDEDFYLYIVYPQVR